MAAYCDPYVARGDLGQMTIPVMYQGGTRDLAVDLSPGHRRFDRAYELSSAPKYYVEFDGADHLAWVGRGEMFEAPIGAYSIAFFDYYLKGRAKDLAALLATPDSQRISYLKFEAW